MNKYLITIDTDWANEEMINYVIDYLVRNSVKATWFITHDSPSIRRLFSYPELFEIGIHPNFDEDSTQGKTPDEVMLNMFGICGVDHHIKCVRTHKRLHSPDILRTCKKFNLMYDLSILLYKTPNIAPHKIYFSGGGSLVRIPYFWEDAEECKEGGDFEFYNPENHVNGIKIFNFHPTHIFLNSNSMNDYYDFVENPNIRIDRDKKGANRFFKELVEFLKTVSSLKVSEIFSGEE